MRLTWAPSSAKFLPPSDEIATLVGPGKLFDADAVLVEPNEVMACDLATGECIMAKKNAEGGFEVDKDFNLLTESRFFKPPLSFVENR